MFELCKKETDVFFSDMSVDTECMWFEPKWSLSRNDGGGGVILPSGRWERVGWVKVVEELLFVVGRVG